MLNKLNKRRGGFTLVEIMIVVAIIALLAAIAVPGFLRARKRSQASRIINDLRLIDAAVDQYAIETNKTSGVTVNMTDWTNYLKKGTILYTTGEDIFGSRYGAQTVDTLPQVPTRPEDTLSDVADDRVLVSLQLRIDDSFSCHSGSAGSGRERVVRSEHETRPLASPAVIKHRKIALLVCLRNSQPNAAASRWWKS